MDIAFVFAGLGVGFIVGLTGVGGGALMTPLLILGFGVAPAVSVGTDLLYAAISKSGGVLVHQRHRSIVWAIAWRMLAGSLPAALLTGWFLQGLQAEHTEYEQILSACLSVMLILTAFVLFSKGWWQQKLKGRSSFLPRRWRGRAVWLSGVVLGVMVTLSSVGAGALGAALLSLLFPRLPTRRIVGTDLAHAVPLTAVAGLAHWQLGHVDFALLGGLLIGALPGIWAGSLLGLRLPEKLLRPVLAGMLLFLGLRFAF